MNCWEYKKCGREENGVKAKSLGVCPACTEQKTDGIHNGKNGGRACWAIAGTLCNGAVQGSFAQKASDCMKCDFYQMVVKEHLLSDLKTPTQIMNLLV